jgi:hypothetical protein
MTPIEFLGRLAALLPPPRHPLVRYHGVLAPKSPHRSAVVPEHPSASVRRIPHPARPNPGPHADRAEAAIGPVEHDRSRAIIAPAPTGPALATLPAQKAVLASPFEPVPGPRPNLASGSSPPSTGLAFSMASFWPPPRASTGPLFCVAPTPRTSSSVRSATGECASSPLSRIVTWLASFSPSSAWTPTRHAWPERGIQRGRARHCCRTESTSDPNEPTANAGPVARVQFGSQLGLAAPQGSFVA